MARPDRSDRIFVVVVVEIAEKAVSSSKASSFRRKDELFLAKKIIGCGHRAQSK